MADCLTLEYFSGYSVQYCLFFLEMCCVTVSVHCQVLYGLFVCSVHCGNSTMVVWTVTIMLQWCCHCYYYAPTQHLGQLPPSRPPELCGLQSHPCMDIDLPWSVGAYHLVAHVLTFVSMSTNILARRAGVIINFYYHCNSCQPAWKCVQNLFDNVQQAVVVETWGRLPPSVKRWRSGL